MALFTYLGGCDCGTVSIEAGLRGDASHYCLRACDCSFCVKHGAAYLSDPQGRLLIRANAQDSLGRYRQGSGNAECLFCGKCGVLAALVCRIDGRWRGTLNSRMLDEMASFGEPVRVSPKCLSPEEKMERWKQMWFGDVEIDAG
ncbi:GFA family protein [Noviherbaspirillum aerium]|uniref:aldehyde-activating protein n=1 Tax=Noviherbaspirillum aerium TaxID=2588497 RepID=UPI00124F52CE|nr:aldehyde-activating protein [Noviherbaspirillum aerium]